MARTEQQWNEWGGGEGGAATFEPQLGYQRGRGRKQCRPAAGRRGGTAHGRSTRRPASAGSAPTGPHICSLRASPRCRRCAQSPGPPACSGRGSQVWRGWCLPQMAWARTACTAGWVAGWQPMWLPSLHPLPRKRTPATLDRPRHDTSPCPRCPSSHKRLPANRLHLLLSELNLHPHGLVCSTGKQELTILFGKRQAEVVSQQQPVAAALDAQPAWQQSLAGVARRAGTGQGAAPPISPAPAMPAMMASISCSLTCTGKGSHLQCLLTCAGRAGMKPTRLAAMRLSVMPGSGARR